VSRADVLCTFSAAFPVVVQALETLFQDGDGKARGYLCSIKQFDFIIALCAAKYVLSNSVALSTMLQGKSQSRSHRGSPRSKSGNKYHES